MSAHTLELLLANMRMRAQLSSSVCERISVARDIALFIKIGGWVTELVATDYIGQTTSDAAKEKRRKLDSAYDQANREPLGDGFTEACSACRGGTSTVSKFEFVMLRSRYDVWSIGDYRGCGPKFG